MVHAAWQAARIAARTLTIVIPTHERPAAVSRLLDGLARQLADPALGAGADVVVIDDGSSAAPVERPYPVPLQLIRQPNAGPAAARNRGLAAATGELVWFLDDDMLPTEGLLARHRAAHAEGEPRVLMGPCLPAPGTLMVGMVREWAEQVHRELAPAGTLTHPAHFMPANTSAPLALWREAGGFDAQFVGWGVEDYEIAVRLLRAGVRIDYDPLAVAWHDQRRDLAGFLDTKRDEGRNTVRVVRLHPEALDDLIPLPRGSRRVALLRRLGGRSARRHRALAAVARAGARGERALTGGRRRTLQDLAAQAHFVSGVVEADAGGDLTARLLGL